MHSKRTAIDPDLNAYVNKRYVATTAFLNGEYTCGVPLVVTGVASSGHLICMRLRDGAAVFRIDPETLATLACPAAEWS